MTLESILRSSKIDIGVNIKIIGNWHWSQYQDHWKLVSDSILWSLEIITVNIMTIGDDQSQYHDHRRLSGSILWSSEMVRVNIMIIGNNQSQNHDHRRWSGSVLWSSEMMSLPTSTILLGEVREPPNIAKSNSIPTLVVFVINNKNTYLSSICYQQYLH